MRSIFCSKFVGLRPGEKLYEELRHLRAGCTDTSHPRIVRLADAPVTLEQVGSHFRRLQQQLHTASADDLKLMLKEILPEYAPHFSSAKVLAHSNSKIKSYEKTAHVVFSPA